MRTAIAIMAKAPVAGRCKTRLQPDLTPEQSARVSAAFLRDITANLARAAQHAAITPYLAYAPAGEAHLFAGLLHEATQMLLADGKLPCPEGVTGFGACLWHAISDLFDAGFDAVCVLNADSPTLPTDCLVSAATRLTSGQADAVLGPADDGGYYLLGMRARMPHLLRDISWSTAEVAAQTRARAAQAAIRLEELPGWYDVDDSASLHRLADELCRGTGPGFAAPASRACLHELHLLHSGAQERGDAAA